MNVGDRIRQRLTDLGMSQSELARRVGINQSTVAALLTGRSRSSGHLHSIARSLATTTAFLVGETDDPDENAPPPPPKPVVHHVMMAVALPSEAALARMFLGLLKASKNAASMDEQAQLLAKRLPNALSQLRDMLPDTAPMVSPLTERPAALATPGREHRR
ncbi:helix-turn-helix transcriptional regulator [Sphingomonas sp. PP-CE-1G-424]|uniref:helix-turn-helix domain-containing protein n=1 Tax=Sphingomonas sp. PP-CE-1G-424 TaxID=2135658 RepID=UPI0010546CFA|nr:helix-turn-helix transcriptional regulator [Sphingomonas sp. PP-CE-1G-424]